MKFSLVLYSNWLLVASVVTATVSLVYRQELSASLVSLPTSTGSTNSTMQAVPSLNPILSASDIIAGIFLLIPGLIYGFYSMKYEQLHTFFSNSFLGALAVSCLIIFVENLGAPQSHHIGYVIAAIISGIFLGGLSVVFSAFFQGMACVLGGFCMSMWLLTIKDDGLFRNKVGIILFICVSSLVAGIFSLNRVTRPWALVVCIPFASATAIILGIDCFSRAGYKEFWIYAWHINMNLFPLDTITYPVNRGMRVESCCIILIFLVSFAFNKKLRRTIDRCDTISSAKKHSKRQDLDKLESEIGMRTELLVASERAEWERLYGDKARKDGESTKPSTRGSEKDRPVSSYSFVKGAGHQVAPAAATTPHLHTLKVEVPVIAKFSTSTVLPDVVISSADSGNSRSETSLTEKGLAESNKSKGPSRFVKQQKTFQWAKESSSLAEQPQEDVIEMTQQAPPPSISSSLPKAVSTTLNKSPPKSPDFNKLQAELLALPSKALTSPLRPNPRHIRRVQSARFSLSIPSGETIYEMDETEVDSPVTVTNSNSLLDKATSASSLNTSRLPVATVPLQTKQSVPHLSSAQQIRRPDTGTNSGFRPQSMLALKSQRSLPTINNVGVASSSSQQQSQRRPQLAQQQRHSMYATDQGRYMNQRNSFASVESFNNHQPAYQNTDGRKSVQDRATMYAELRASLGEQRGQQQQNFRTSPSPSSSPHAIYAHSMATGSSLPTNMVNNTLIGNHQQQQPQFSASNQSFTSWDSIQAHRNTMIQEKRARQTKEQQAAWEKRQRAEMMEMSLRSNPNMMAIHARRLSEIQAQVKF